MKKIMFNDQFGLTKAVLEGRKTQTRRIVRNVPMINRLTAEEYHLYDKLEDVDFQNYAIRYYSPYAIGKEIAIAQSYKDANYIKPYGPEKVRELMNTPGWNNKMFVKAELMPYRIRITNIRIEQVSDITNEDALLEGIKFVNQIEVELGIAPAVYAYGRKDEYEYETPRSAFLGLCCHLRLPQTAWVFVYDFVLVEKGE